VDISVRKTTAMTLSLQMSPQQDIRGTLSQCGFQKLQMRKNDVPAGVSKCMHRAAAAAYNV
jgi:hypothetical protein